MGCLYKIDFPNGKSYIGITMLTAEIRFSQHLYAAKSKSNRLILNALRKFGEDNVKVTTLVHAFDPEYLQAIEISAIKSFETLSPFGYNLTGGGEGMLHYKHSEEAKLKISAASKGNTHAKGWKHSEEAKDKIRKASIGRKPMLGKIMSIEARMKISEANIGRVSAMLGKKHTLNTKNKMSESAKHALSTPLSRTVRAIQTATYWAIKKGVPVCVLKEKTCVCS